MKQTCLRCRWFHKEPGKPPACYWKGKWRKLLPIKLVDKPNDCINFET